MRSGWVFSFTFLSLYVLDITQHYPCFRILRGFCFKQKRINLQVVSYIDSFLGQLLGTQKKQLTLDACLTTLKALFPEDPVRLKQVSFL